MTNDTVEARPQLKEPMPIEAGKLFDPFKELSGQKVIPENFESQFQLPKLGRVVFRFSRSIPGGSEESPLADKRYVWTEVALDSDLEESRYEQLRHGLNLTVTNPVTKQDFIGFPDIAEPQEDRYKFASWGLTHEFGTKLPDSKPEPLVIEEKSLSRLMAVVQTT